MHFHSTLTVPWVHVSLGLQDREGERGREVTASSSFISKVMFEKFEKIWCTWNCLKIKVVGETWKVEASIRNIVNFRKKESRAWASLRGQTPPRSTITNYQGLNLSCRWYVPDTVILTSKICIDKTALAFRLFCYLGNPSGYLGMVRNVISLADNERTRPSLLDWN